VNTWAGLTVYHIISNFCGFGLKRRHLIFADFFFCRLKILAPKKKILYYRKQQLKRCYDKQLVHITVMLRSKNIFNSLESFLNTHLVLESLLNTHLVNFKFVLRNNFFHWFRDLFCWQEIWSQQLDRYRYNLWYFSDIYIFNVEFSYFII
jgi:hypothetical protein